MTRCGPCAHCGEPGDWSPWWQEYLCPANLANHEEWWATGNLFADDHLLDGEDPSHLRRAKARGLQGALPL